MSAAHRRSDQQLGTSYATALAGSNAPSPQLRQAMLLDLLGADRSLWPALRHLIEQPGFETLRRDPSRAIRLAGREAWLQELATWSNQESLARVGAFLDGLLGLAGNPSQASHRASDQAKGASKPSAQPSQPEVSSQQGGRDPEASRLSDQGIEASNRGDHQRALALFNDALRRDSGDALLYLQRASVQALLGQTEAAILDFDAVLRLQPSNLEALAQRGKANATLGRFEAAKQDWQQASDRGHRKAGDWLCRQLQMEQRQEKAQQPTNAGQQADEQNQQDRTTSSTAAQPARDLYQQGLASRDRGDLARAFEQLTQAIQIDSSYADAYAERAMLQARAGNLPLALEDLTAVLRLDPHNIEARILRGKIHESRRDLASALRDWQEAAERGHPEARRWVANDCWRRAREEATRNNHRQAISLITKAIAFGEARPEALLLRATSYRTMQEHEHALRDLSQALQLEPENSDALIQRGHVLVALNRQAEANADWRRASALGNPNAPNLAGLNTGQKGRTFAQILGCLCLVLFLAGIHLGWPLGVQAACIAVAAPLLRQGGKQQKS